MNSTDTTLPGIEWIIFDAADTLIRPEPSVANAYHAMALKHQVAVPPSSIKSRFGPAIRRHFADLASNEELDRARWRQLVFDVLETDCEAIFDDLWTHFAEPSHWRLYDDVATAWKTLAARGYRLAIASNFDARLLGIVDSLPPINTAEHVFVSSQLGHRKPGNDFFRSVESKLGKSRERLLMVGDSVEADYMGAKKAGWHAVLLDRSAREKGEHVIVTLEDLLTL